MKKFENLTESQRKKTQEILDDLVSKCSPDQIEAAKRIFWETADKAGDRETYRQLEPKWCAAIEALPNTDKFYEINEMLLEISVDIVKRSRSEEK